MIFSREGNFIGFILLILIDIILTNMVDLCFLELRIYINGK
jgi:hypothetical protein